MGSFIKQFEPGSIDSAYHCQVFCFREKKDHPQILATSRHISCGGVDLQQVEWKANSLKGKSQTVPGEDYTLYIYEPEHSSFKNVITENQVTIQGNEKMGNMRKVVLRSLSGEMMDWEIIYN
jgi:hypothetical protein